MDTIWTIGHSTRSLSTLVDMLVSHEIDMLIDVRQYPGSRKYPHFNKEKLTYSIPASNIEYVHIVELGGRRKVKKDSLNTRWRKDSFRGYADHMETSMFDNGIHQLKKIAKTQKVCYMCSEAVWWRCHRSMISDFLKSLGWDVRHIMGVEQIEPHRYTQPARIVNNVLSYREEQKLQCLPLTFN